jgi:hypothetical protein
VKYISEETVLEKLGRRENVFIAFDSINKNSLGLRVARQVKNIIEGYVYTHNGDRFRLDFPCYFYQQKDVYSWQLSSDQIPVEPLI